MKRIISILCGIALLSTVAYGQAEKSKRPSPPVHTNVTTNDGVTIDIHYSSPSLNGRQIGVEVAEVNTLWRTGANEATTIAFDKDVTVEGKKLAAGKYSLYSIPGEYQTTIIINKQWNQWGTKYDKAEDALRVDVENDTDANSAEKFKIAASKSGAVTLAWGQYRVSFSVKAQ